jgi:hypothetical protein
MDQTQPLMTMTPMDMAVTFLLGIVAIWVYGKLPAWGGDALSGWWAKRSNSAREKKIAKLTHELERYQRVLTNPMAFYIGALRRMTWLMAVMWMALMAVLMPFGFWMLHLEDKLAPLPALLPAHMSPANASPAPGRVGRWHGKRRQLPLPSLAAVAVVPQSVLHFRHSIFCWGTAVMRDKSLNRRSFLMSSTASLGGILALAAGTGRAAAFEVQNLGPGAPLALDIQNRCSADATHDDIRAGLEHDLLLRSAAPGAS